MITFAGVPLLLEDPQGQVNSFIRRYWESPLSAINAPPRTIDTRSLCQIPNWPDPPELKINQLYIPSGATRWSRGLFLTDDEGMRTLQNVSYGQLVIGCDYPNLVASATSSRLIRPATERVSSITSTSTGQWNTGGYFSAIMFKLDPIPIAIKGERVLSSSSGGGGSSSSGIAPRPNYLYLIPLVDERYYWQGINLVSTATNWGEVAGGLSSSSSSGSSNGSTGFGLLGDIAAALSTGALGSPTPQQYISGSYFANNHPSYLAYRSGPFPAAAGLDLLAWSNNMLLVPDDHTNVTEVPGTGYATRYRLIGSGATEPQPSSSGSGSSVFTPFKKQATPLDFAIGQKNAVLWQGGPQSVAGNDKYDAIAHDVPATIQMSFSNPQRLSQEMYKRTVSPPSSITEYGSATMRIKNLASVDSGNSNSTKLNAIADQWGRNWYENNRARFDWTFNGMPVLKFCGVEDFIMYDQARRPRGEYGAFTRWKSLPAHFGYEFIAQETSEHKDDEPNTGGGGGTEGGCGCCDCFNCLQSQQVLVGCCSAASNGAALSYIINIGEWAQYPLFTPNGYITLTNQSPLQCSSVSSMSSIGGGSDDCCMWYSCMFTVCESETSSSGSSSGSSSSSGGPRCGVYQWQKRIYLDANGLCQTKVIPVLLAGVDWLRIAETW